MKIGERERYDPPPRCIRCRVVDVPLGRSRCPECQAQVDREREAGYGSPAMVQALKAAHERKNRKE
jgi:hypothetical protein